MDRVEQLMKAWQVELPDVLHPTTELAKRLMTLNGELTESTRQLLPELGLTTAEFDVLVTLRRSGPPFQLKPSELSRGLLLSTGGTSNLTNQLANRGLVVREADPDDGRGTQIRLTDEGVALAEKAVRAASAAHADHLADVPPELVEQATRALREISRLTAARGTTPGRARRTPVS
ncbi:MarR family transcriptional regulator [Kribbella sp. NBC_01245]|uniref:MarR family winged helix-turn-helix transcriptional regulator n=1 Tax=Kribbella sp. NBC_01245 TaxID=2903578 RepID=UPI002E298DF7|nr:MarR family transcriptional regulator [Kribbella sp. NBC_01245]